MGIRCKHLFQNLSLAKEYIYIHHLRPAIKLNFLIKMRELNQIELNDTSSNNSINAAVIEKKLRI